ncbi:MAG: hypothetical protein O2954_10435, partial [bacterium]|nr:hypothetical protein [bacterium]
MPNLLIHIPNKSIGFIPGTPVSIHLHALGFQPQTVQIRFLINDPLGATRLSLRDEDRSINAEHTVLPFTCDLESDFPPGTYLITAQIHSETQNLRVIATESFDLVLPGQCLPDGFPAAHRDRITDARHTFAPMDRPTLEQTFRTAHETCQRGRNPDGSWGQKEDGTPVEYRTPGNLILGYLYAHETLANDEYLTIATAGLEYLLTQQEESGAYRWWRPGYPEGVFNQRDPFYDTGWAGLALAEGYRITGENKYLDAVRKAADWTLTCPFTGNNNYDAFALWFLALLFELSSEQKYLDAAVHRAEGGTFFAQLPRGGWPGHNFHIGYQSITANGLASVYNVLPKDHPFRNPLEERLCMALNFSTFLQDPKGDHHQGWEYDRNFHLDANGNPTGNTGPARAELVRAFYKTRTHLNVPTNLFNGLC